MVLEADLEAARARIADAVVRTPVWRSDELDEALGCSVWLKCEPLQRTGSFKLRGATNAIRSLPERARAEWSPSPAATTPRQSPAPGAPPACPSRS